MSKRIVVISHGISSHRFSTNIRFLYEREMLNHFAELENQRKERERKQRLQKLTKALMLERPERKSSSPDPQQVPTDVDVAVSEATTECGGDSSEGSHGESSSGDDDDDGEPPINVLQSNSPEWWQISLVIAAIIAIASSLIYLILRKPDRFLVPITIVSFLATFGISLYFNPKLWYRRMAELSLSSLAGVNLLSGFTVQIPLHPEPLEWSVESPHWVVSATLGVLTILFTRMHFWESQRK